MIVRLDVGAGKTFVCASKLLLLLSQELAKRLATPLQHLLELCKGLGSLCGLGRGPPIANL